MIHLMQSRFHAHVARHDWVYRVIQGVLLYAPSLYFLPTISLLCFVGFSLLCFPWVGRYDWRKDWPFYAFAVFAACNALYGLFQNDVPFVWYRSNGITGGIVLLLAFFAARTITTRALYALLACLGVSAIAVLAQSFMGVRVFFDGQLTDFIGIPYYYTEYKNCTMGDLASFMAKPVQCVLRRGELEPFSFHASPATAVLMMLIGCWLTLLLPMPHRVRVLAYALFVAGSFITNGRAALFIISIMTFFWIAYELWRKRLTRADIFTSFGGALLAGFLLVVSGNYCANVLADISGVPAQKIQKSFHTPIRKTQSPRPYAIVQNQNVLTCFRNHPFISTYPVLPDKSDPTLIDRLLRKVARYEMWTSAYDAILKRPWLGTHGQRLPVYHSVYANNGYLSLLITHGIMGTALLALFYFRRIFEQPKRFLLLLPLLLSNVTNDTLFWYLSAADILAFYVLTRKTAALFPLAEPERVS